MPAVTFRSEESGKICGSIEDTSALDPAYQGHNLQVLR